MEAEIVSNLSEFYTTTDENRRAFLNEWLTKAQVSDEAWYVSWSLLNTSNDVGVQLFAANCIYQKLTSKFVQISPEEVERLNGLLTTTCLCSTVPVVTGKLCDALSVFILQTSPDIWPDSVENAARTFAVTNPKILLNIFASLIVEFRKLPLPLDRRNVVRAFLRKNEASIANYAGQMLNSSGDDYLLVDAAVKCIDAWVEFEGTDLNDWQQIIILCLARIESPTLISCVSKFFLTFVENSELNRMDNFVSQLFDYASNLTTFSHNFRGVENDDDAYTDLAKMVVGLAANHAKVWLKLLKTPTSSASNVVDFVLHLSALRGFYPVDETLSILPVPCWYNLHEEATVVRDRDVYDENLAVVCPIYAKLLAALITKVEYPPDDAYALWTRDDKEQFEYYRSELADTICCCFRVNGSNMAEQILDAATRRMDSDEFRSIESILYVYESIGDYVTVENPFVRRFLTDIFHRTPLGTPILTNTVFRVISKFHHLIVDLQLTPTYVSMILPYLNVAQFVPTAVSALRDLTSSRDNTLTTVGDATVKASLRCFESDANLDRDRLYALSCVGFVLSMLPVECVLTHLNEILAPRLEKLGDFSETRFRSKSQLLFEFDVVTTLIGALSWTGSNEDAERKKPTFLVVSQSLDLFRSVYAASDGDEEVASKLCHFLKGGVVALLDELAPIVPKYCELMQFMFERAKHSCVVELAKTLFLMFAADQPHRPTLIGTYNFLLDRTSTYLDANTTHVAEAFLNFSFSLSKKNYSFLSLDFGGMRCDTSRTVELALRCLNLDDSTTTKEAALFLSEFVRHVECPVVLGVVERYGSAIMVSCFERVKTEPLTSCLEYVADVMYFLATNYKQCLGTWLGLLPQHSLVSSMMKEMGNKRKFRDFAKQINNGCRRNVIIF